MSPNKWCVEEFNTSRNTQQSHLNLVNAIKDVRDLSKVTLLLSIFGLIATFLYIRQPLGHPLSESISSGLLVMAVMSIAWHIWNAYIKKQRYSQGILLLILIAVPATLVIQGIISYKEFFQATAFPGRKKLELEFLLYSVFLASTIGAAYWARDVFILGQTSNPKFLEFSKKVGLLGFLEGAVNKASNGSRVRDKVIELIDSELDTIDILLINGYDDLVKNRKIIEALKRAKANNVMVRILLSDPLSEFAEERAQNLYSGDYGRQKASLLYVWQFLQTKRALKQAGLSFRMYCSRPLFRMYLGESKAKGEKFVISQSYLLNCHGFQTPAYHHVSNQENTQSETFVTLATEAFTFIWDRSFAYYPIAQGGIEPSLVAYMFKMYKGQTNSPNASTLEDQRQYLKSVVREKIRAVKNAERAFQTRHSVESPEGWVQLKKENDSVIVFVHGFISSSTKCWSSTNGTFWPKLIASNFPSLNVFHADFFTSANSGPYGLTAATTDLFSLLKRQDGPSVSKSVLEHKNIIFVGHSTGGLLIKKMLVENQSISQNAKQIGVALVASPSNGSKLASWLPIRFLTKLIRNNLATSLQLNSPELVNLHESFESLKNREKETISGIDMFESKRLVSFPFFHYVVSPTASPSYFKKIVIPNVNHFEIAKPSSEKDSANQHLSDLIKLILK
jgi:hypothetical protein